MGDLSVNVVNVQEQELQTYQEAMASPDAPFWKEACAEELKSFIKTQLYDEVERLKG
jgi:hypothetical protein